MPFLFDVVKLQADLKHLVGDTWNNHYNEQAYEGNWKLISLYSGTGEENEIFAEQNTTSSLIETAIMKKSRYFREVVNEFKCELLSVRLMKLSVGAVIKPHKDFKLGYEDDNFRIHIPIITNDSVKFILGGERLVMAPGECWYTNVNHTHSVTNEGEVDRVHLVIDGQRNEWSDKLFFSLAPKENLVKSTEKNKIETYKRMIEELGHMKSEATIKLIDEIQQKVKDLEKE